MYSRFLSCVTINTKSFPRYPPFLYPISKPGRGGTLFRDLDPSTGRPRPPCLIVSLPTGKTTSRPPPPGIFMLQPMRGIPFCLWHFLLLVRALSLLQFLLSYLTLHYQYILGIHKLLPQHPSYSNPPKPNSPAWPLRPSTLRRRVDLNNIHV